MNLKRFRNQSKSPEIRLAHTPQPNYFAKRRLSPNLSPLGNYYSPLKQYNRIRDPEGQPRSPSLSPQSSTYNINQGQHTDLKRMIAAKPTGKAKQYKRKEQKKKQENKPSAEQIQAKRRYQQKCKDQLFKYYYQKKIKEEPKPEQDSFQKQYPQVHLRAEKLARKIQNAHKQLFRVKTQEKLIQYYDPKEAFLLYPGHFQESTSRFKQIQQTRNRDDGFQLKIQSKWRQSPFQNDRKQTFFDRLFGQKTPEKVFDRYPRQKSSERIFGHKPTYFISSILKGYKNRQSQAYKHISKSISQLKICKALKYSAQYDEIIRLRKQSSVKQKFKHVGKKTVVLDLDETLICADQKSLKTSRDQQVVKFYYMNKQYKLPISIRPYARQLIKNIAQKCEVLVFTASAKDYAYAICDILDPEKKYIEHIYHIDYVATTSKKDIYGCTVKVKDLRIINRDLSQVVLIDNHPYSYGFQIENGIPIIDYLGEDDFELKELEKYIENHIIPAKDVREVNRKFFKQHQFVNYDVQQVSKLVQDLYKR